MIGLLHREVGVPSYVRLDDVVVAREVDRPSGRIYRMDDRNSMIVVVCADDVARRVAEGVTALGERVGRGVRVFATPAEAVV